ncbi:hypothetical protein FQA39_LY06805 [Lamprigera yunnana]|nr:hypothetical protein FQA39_LY06805 [Lamprigera yunnana]
MLIERNININFSEFLLYITYIMVLSTIAVRIVHDFMLSYKFGQKKQEIRNSVGQEINNVKHYISTGDVRSMNRVSQRLSLLLGDELSYELTIRGLTSEGSVEGKRATFRGILQAERAGQMFPQRSTLLNSNNEVVTCQLKLTDLDRDIANFNHNNKDNEFTCNWSLEQHHRQKLRRIKNSLVQQAVILIDKVAQVVEYITKKTNESFILDEPLLLEIHTLSSTTCVPPEVHHTQINSPLFLKKHDDRLFNPSTSNE